MEVVFEEVIAGDSDNGDGYERVTEGGTGKGWGEAGRLVTQGASRESRKEPHFV